MLPATSCCQRPDWPGKRQIRRTIALDFYLSNVYGPLAGQAVAQSSALADSQRLQKNNTHYTTIVYSASPFAYSLIKQFFFTILLGSHIFYDIQLILMHTRSDIGTAIQAILRYFYAPFAQGSAIF